MKVLAVTNMMPSPLNPRSGTFVEQQIVGIKSIGIEIDVLLIDRPNLGMRQYTKTREMVRSKITNTRYDVIHIMYAGVMAYLATKETSQFPTVVSFCGVDLLGADYGSPLFRLRTRLGVWASYRAAERADAIVVKSRNLEQGLPPGIDRANVFIIPNGINMERFKPMRTEECRRRLGWSPDSFHILFSTADRSNKKKRLQLAEKALAVLRKRGITAEIHGLGRIPHDVVPVWLNAADVVLMTSTSDEGSPNIIKEALACNRPVVSLDVGDVAERLEGIDGCYIASESPIDLADCLSTVRSGPGFVESRVVVGQLSIESVARRILEVYELAVRRHKGDTV